MMEEFFSKYIDMVVLAFSIVMALVFTFRMAAKATVPVRLLPLFFLLLGASIIAGGMVGHLGENGYRAIGRAVAGDFVFTFHFYSLMLMGIVFLAISGYMLNQVNGWVLGSAQAKSNFIKAAVIISLLSAPTYFIVPIGLVPTIACVISLVAMPFTVKRRKEQLTFQPA